MGRVRLMRFGIQGGLGCVRLGLLPLLMSAACGPTVTVTEDAELGIFVENIIAGKEATGFPEAGFMNMDMTASGGYACSLALIAPRVVLTAGHCVDGHGTFDVYVGGSYQRSVEASVLDYENNSEYVQHDQHDVGLVFLSQPLALADGFPSLDAQPMPFGGTVVNVGRVLDTKVTKKMYQGQAVIQDGAHIGYPLHYRSEKVIESGDSGGPVFALDTHRIVAVNSGSGGSTQILARTDLVYDWITAEVQAHGGWGGTQEEPAPEPPPAEDPPTPTPPPDEPGGGDEPTPEQPAPDTCALEHEPNDALSQAESLGAETCGVASGAADVDVFRTSVEGSVRVTLASQADASFTVGRPVGNVCIPVASGLVAADVKVLAATEICIAVAAPAGASGKYTLRLTER